MKSTVYCVVSDKGKHSFYLEQDNSKYYLFTQSYRKSVQNYYGRGVILDEAVNFNRSKHDSAIINTMEKLPSYIKYIEKEFEISVLKKTKNKKDQRLGCKDARKRNQETNIVIDYADYCTA